MFINFGKRQGKKRIAFFVDGPNMLRREFDLDLAVVKKQVEQHGTIAVAKIFLNQFAPDKLIEAVINQGFEPIIVTSDDTDAPMAAEAMEYVFNPNIDTICIMTRDSDFQILLSKAKKYGKQTIVVGSEPFGAALKNTADITIILDKNQRHNRADKQ